jgi:hypothetical protein
MLCINENPEILELGMCRELMVVWPENPESQTT